MELTDYKKLNKFQNPYVVKCILLGDTGTGKSSILNILKTGIFDGIFETTVGIDFATKIISLNDDQQIKLQIWDTAGQEKFKSLITSYLRDVYIALLVFDITDRRSWNSLEYWKRELTNNSRYNNIPLMVIVGTKTDLNGHIVDEEEIIKRAEEWKCGYYLISLKNPNISDHIVNLFTVLTEKFHQIVMSNYINGIEIPTNIKNFNKISIKLIDKKQNKCC